MNYSGYLQIKKQDYKLTDIVLNYAGVQYLAQIL
jgi:hypothetical protein